MKKKMIFWVAKMKGVVDDALKQILKKTQTWTQIKSNGLQTLDVNRSK